MGCTICGRRKLKNISCGGGGRRRGPGRGSFARGRPSIRRGWLDRCGGPGKKRRHERSIVRAGRPVTQLISTGEPLPTAVRPKTWRGAPPAPKGYHARRENVSFAPESQAGISLGAEAGQRERTHGGGFRRCELPRTRC